MEKVKKYLVELWDDFFAALTSFCVYRSARKIPTPYPKHDYKDCNDGGGECKKPLAVWRMSDVEMQEEFDISDNEVLGGWRYSSIGNKNLR